MKHVLYFFAGALVGLGGGFMLGKRHEKKKREGVKETVQTITVVKEEKEDAHDPEILDPGIEVENVARQQRYVIDEEDVDYDAEDLQNDIEEIDDYICDLEHPEDDDEPAPRPLERITTDDFYTSRSDFDKVRLVLEHPGTALMDQLGNDVTDIFARNGISLDQLYFESNRGEDMVYYRSWKMDTDYEILVDGGGSE